MTSRERVITALEHKEADRVPVDLGAMLSTGIMGIAYNKLKNYLGISSGRTRMYDLGQQLAEPEIEILEQIGADVLPLFISEPKKWKPSKLPDGSPCGVPESFNPELMPDGSKVLRDDAGNITAKMPRHGYYFDGVYHPLESINAIDAYIFIHTCGSVYEFIPDFIEMGIDILNPVQVSAKNMDTKKLKDEFGKDITFWGGGCDTQEVLPFGTPSEVEEEVKKRIEDLAPDGGFVFTQVHNIQAGVPPENIMAMYEAVKNFGKY